MDVLDYEIDEVEEKLRIKEKNFTRYVVLGAIILAVGISTLSYKHGSRNRDLQKRVMIKADVNKDGILQNTEISGLLKTIGSTEVIPENKNISVNVNTNGTYVGRDRYGNTEVVIQRSDAEKYLNL